MFIFLSIIVHTRVTSWFFWFSMHVDGLLATGGGGDLIFNPNQKLSITQQRLALPIYALRRQILYLLETKQTLVVVGHTGCGKTTQLPQYLVEAGWADGQRTIVCTQPRRVAAMSVAARVAEETGTTLGSLVGYSVRFDDAVSPSTKIKYMTDGMLIREMMLDPLLMRYPVVMIDEAHERSLPTDLLMGLLKKVQARRKDLKIIVSSATLDAEEMCAFFNNNKTGDKAKDTAAILSIEGRNYPVDIHYLETASVNYLETTLQTIVDIHLTQPPGDILVFLTGQEEIDKLRQAIEDRLDAAKQGGRYRVLPIYSGMPMAKQLKVFERADSKTRKIVLATNIAETSITIDGIVYVVDCGFVKIKAYSGRSGLESLVVVPTSKSSADQRAGRAGRNRPGKCYRLYTQEAFDRLQVHTVPEIQRANLAPVLLQLKALGIDNLLNFDFMSPPPPASLTRALEVLYALGALDDAAKLTERIGMVMAEFPIEPPFAKMILASATFGCSDEVLTIAAMLNVQGIFVNQTSGVIRRNFGVKEGDHLTLLNIFNAFSRKKNPDASWCHSNQLNFKAMLRVIQVRKQLLAYAHKYRIPIISCLSGNQRSTTDATVPIRKSIVAGFFTNAAHLQPEGSYLTVKDKHTASNERDVDKIRSSLQRVIYYMTMGIDVQPLFPDIIMVVNTTDLIVKKMIMQWLGLTNTKLKRDSLDSNPMVRGLALRSLCSLNSTTTLEYALKVVTRSLGDVSAYVRKTAVMGLAKLYHISPKEERSAMIEDLLPKIYGMIMDQDSQVIVNAILTLDEVRPAWEVTQSVTHHLLAKFKELNEWGQCAVLATLHRYETNEEEMFDFLNLFDDRLKQSNTAVVMAAAKLFIKITEGDDEIHEQVYERLRVPMVSLMENSESSETAYTVLNHIHLLMSRAPDLFRRDYRHFYLKHRDTFAVRCLKVRVLKELACPANVVAITGELAEYVYESSAAIDSTFTALAIDALSFISRTVPAQSSAILRIFLRFLGCSLPAIQPCALVALCDHLRHYPTDAATVLPLAAPLLATLPLDASAAIESILWMLGEFPMLVEDSPYTIERFFDAQFEKSPSSTRIQLLITVTRIFLSGANQTSRAAEIYPILLKVYNACSSIDCDPDLRDQFLSYSRLLLLDITKASKIINAKPTSTIVDASFVEDEILEIRDKIFDEFNTLSVVYGKHSSTFIKSTTTTPPLAIMPVQTQDLHQEIESSSLNIMDTFVLEKSPELQPSEFQSLWMDLDEGMELQLERRVDSNVVENVLSQHGVVCLASGSVDGQTKMYYHAKEIDDGPLFLVELLVIDTSLRMSITLKSTASDLRTLHAKFLPRLLGALSKCIPGLM
eukprot:gene15465-18352_t